MAIQLYSSPRSSGTRVHWALEELGVPYDYVAVDLAAGENRQAAYLAVNPNGKVPALVDDGQPYFESLAILLHLGERYGETAGLWPGAGSARADALCWTVWSVTELHAFMMQYAYHGLDTPVSYAPEDRSRATAEYNRAMFEGHLGMLEARLDGRDYLLGAGFSLVDVPAASSVGFGRFLGASLDGRPRVTAWLDRCLDRPARKRAR